MGAVSAHASSTEEARERKRRARSDLVHLRDHAELLHQAQGIVVRPVFTGARAAPDSPSTYAVTIYTRRELVAKQLDGAYRVKSLALRPHYLQARALLDQFKEVEVVAAQSGRIKALLGH